MTLLRRLWAAWFAPALLLFLISADSALARIDVPYLQGRVTDDAEIMRPEMVAAISDRLLAHEASTGNQVAVLTIPTLEGEDIESFAQRVFETWRLGQQGKDNGVLMIIAPQDRRMRIEVGYGLEGALTDLEAGRIIRNIMAPRFRAGDFNGGIQQGVEAVIGQLSGDDTLPVSTQASSAKAKQPLFSGPDLSVVERILIGSFIFGIIGLFTVIGVLTPGMGWFLYFFLIPFWAMFPIVVVGTSGAITLLGIYVVAFPIAKIIIGRSKWFKKAKKELKTKGRARIGGFLLSSGGTSASGGWSSSGSSSSFSGGGGSSGGGGASGSW